MMITASKNQVSKLILGLFIPLLSAISPMQAQSTRQIQDRRDVTVRDSIEMTYIGNPQSRYSGSPSAYFSPDGKQFVVITRKGNLANNTNVYSLLLFRSADAFSDVKPHTLLKWASTSNRPAIDSVQWMQDSQTVVFIGNSQYRRDGIYALNVQTGQLHLVCAAPTDIASFEMTRDSRTLVFLAYPPQKKLLQKEDRERGLVIGDQHILDLLSDHESELEFIHPLELFVKHGNKTPQKINLQTDHPLEVSVSPDGRFAVVEVFVGAVPKAWYGYKSTQIQNAISEAYAGRYDLVDCQTGKVRPLLNAPEVGSFEITWSSDGKSVVLGDTYLPIEADDTQASMPRVFVVEVDVMSGTIAKIAPGPMHVLRWNRNTNTIYLTGNRQVALLDGTQWGKVLRPEDAVGFKKVHGTWTRTKVSSIAEFNSHAGNLDVEDAEDMNTPPRLMVTDQKTERKKLLLDLDPQFKRLKIGPVEEISWKLRDGQQVKGGLYLPPDYVPGKRYPLVIQTHGWNPHQFWMDGESTAGYAAQVLAGKGIIVAQIPIFPELQTIEEGPRQTELYETLIDYLDQRGLINRMRVGLLGWSRSGFHVRYALTFSKYPFAAAVISDPTDDGYVHYMLWLNQGPARAKVYERMIGDAAFGEGLQNWISRATDFRLDRVNTPVRLLSFGQYSPLSNWEWFAGLRYLHKPVEFVWLPDAKHMPVKPFERLTAEEGSVDWFCFWLLSSEDPVPSKHEQYLRWRSLRDPIEKVHLN